MQPNLTERMIEVTQNNNEERINEIGENHIGTSAKTPLRDDAFELSNEEKIARIEESVKDILKKSISFGGSTIKDFHNSEGKIGSFQNYFRVYGRENEKCTRSRCGGMIKKNYHRR